MKNLAFFLCFLATVMFNQASFGATQDQILRDSVLKYGVNIEPYLKSLNDQKIVPGFNYSPYINKFLKEHKYVKFPAYRITVGIDSSFKNYPSHIVVNSGNRLYFPTGSSLACPPDQKTNGYMVFIAWNVKDVFIDGITIIGSKATSGYKTSAYGAGIAMYAPSNILLTNATVSKSSGDGVTVRTHWGKQSENITIKKLTVLDATRVGMLITGIVNGNFRDIYIEGTGENAKDKIVKPQTALSFEPNDCTSKYVNCRFNNLETKNNLGPVLATTNFYNIFVNNTCGKNNIDVIIKNWKDFNDDPACYGASFDVASGDMEPYDTKDISGTFQIINPILTRNRKDDYYFFHGESEKRKGGVKYVLTNVKLRHQGAVYNVKTKNKNKEVMNIINNANKSNKVLIN